MRSRVCAMCMLQALVFAFVNVCGAGDTCVTCVDQKNADLVSLIQLPQCCHEKSFCKRIDSNDCKLWHKAAREELLAECPCTCNRGFAALLEAPATLDGTGDNHTSPDSRLTASLAWFHVPKTGTSFINTIYHSLCPDVPANVSCAHASPKKRSPELDMLLNDAPTQMYCAPKVQLSASAWGGAHLGLDSMGGRDVDHRRVVALFREPRQRMLSGFLDSQHDFPAIRQEVSIATYAEALKGLTVRMMTTGSLDWVPKANEDQTAIIEQPPLDQHDLENALSRLRSVFLFVGITEEWNLSVCLWHAKFGGPCLPQEFDNVRLGTGMNTNESSFPQSWTDPFDEPLYKEAKDIFWRDVALYKLSSEACRRKGCWK